MKNELRSIKGTHDILPNETHKWKELELVVGQICEQYGYKEIRNPIFEETKLFSRSVGEETDIVTKEMYSWKDNDGTSLTLRPELTASVARSFIQHNLGGVSPVQRLYYTGPLFRRERPQKGRQRQFHQFGAEAFGSSNPEQDVEIITIAWRILCQFGLESNTTLNLNSIGSKECRNNYKSALKGFIRPYLNDLSLTSQKRFETNPLRILDTKSEKEQEILNDAPIISEYHTDKDSKHFESLKKLLENNKVPFSINHKLVRGLDYYSGTVFEFNSTNLGAQDALLGGGRYDQLVEVLGGKPTPGIGFAAGMERFLIAIEQSNYIMDRIKPDIYFVCIGEETIPRSIELSNALRKINLIVISDTLRRSMKSQLREANKLKARYALILGENELQKNIIILKDLVQGAQHTLQQSKVIKFFEDMTN